MAAAERLREGGAEHGPQHVGAGTVAVLHHPHAAHRLADVLTPAAYAVHRVEIGRRTIDLVANLRPDVVVVDLADAAFDLPRLCTALRTTTGERIVVVSAAELDDASVVRALDAGADDVVVAPSPALIDARIRVALRAQRPSTSTSDVIEVGDVTIDVTGHTVTVDGRPVRCPPVQFELLGVLAAADGSTVSTDALLRSVWGVRPGEVHPRRVRIAVSVLRNILGEGPRRPRVESVPHVGYRLARSSDASNR
ncbi:MAG: response regulator transcription factor [Ilumatobacteraceae bacterium]